MPAAADEDAPATSMQTDTYDPAQLSLFLADERDRHPGDAAEDPDFGLEDLRAPEEGETAPIDLSGWSADRAAGERADGDERTPAAAPVDEGDADLADEAQRASRAALRWWGGEADPRVSSGG
jgi:macrolide phosphotransferase